MRDIIPRVKKMHESKRYDYDKAEKMIKKEFGDKLRHGEHIVILSKDSSRYFGKSIEKANCGLVDLDKVSIKKSMSRINVPYNVAKRGFSCRVCVNNNSKYIEIWLPRKSLVHK